MQITALVVGIVFLLVGLAGFVPGLITRYGDRSFAGLDSTAMLLGVFHLLLAVGMIVLGLVVPGLTPGGPGLTRSRFSRPAG